MSMSMHRLYKKLTQQAIGGGDSTPARTYWSASKGLCVRNIILYPSTQSS